MISVQRRSDALAHPLVAHLGNHFARARQLAQLPRSATLCVSGFSQ